MSGRRTTLVRIRERAGLPTRIRGELEFIDDGWHFIVRGLFLGPEIADLEAPPTDPSHVEDLAFLSRAEVAIIVIDCQHARLGASLDHVERFRRMLSLARRSPAGMPAVFQLNKQDLGGVGGADLARVLTWPDRRFCSTVATSGVGIAELLATVHGLAVERD